MNNHEVVKLILIERVEEYIDESGATRSKAPDKDPGLTIKLQGELEQVLGAPTRAVTSFAKGGGHAFGGHEVLSSVQEIAYVLATTGVVKGVFEILKGWIELKKTRSIEFEITKKSGEKKRVRVKATSKKDFETIIRQQFMSDQDKESESLQRKAGSKGQFKVQNKAISETLEKAEQTSAPKKHKKSKDAVLDKSHSKGKST